MSKKIHLIITIIAIFAWSNKLCAQNLQNNVEPGIYIFVSFSMNDESLRKYFEEGRAYGAKLVMRGLSGDRNSRNRFALVRSKAQKARINFDIDPGLFEQFNVKQVPLLVFVDKTGKVKKLSGHITINKALEIMQVDPKQFAVKSGNTGSNESNN